MTRHGHPLVPYFFLLPACSLIGGFVLYPALQALLTSFTSFNMITPAQWVGADNYRRLAADPFFWSALRNSLLYLLVAVPVLVVAPIGLAVLVDRACPACACSAPCFICRWSPRWWFRA